MDRQRQYDELQQPSTSDGATSGSQSRNDDKPKLQDMLSKSYIK